LLACAGWRALLQTHALHALFDALLAGRAGGAVKLAQRDAAVLVLGRHLLPFLNPGHSCSFHSILGVVYCRVRRHVPNLDKRHGNETRSTKPTDRLGDKPLGVGLSNHNDSLASLRLQLISPLSLEIVHDNTVDHGAILQSSGFGAALACGGGWRHGRGIRLGIAGIVIWVLGRGESCGGKSRRGESVGLTAVPLGTSQSLKECDGHQAPSVGQSRIAGLVPVRVVLTTDYMEEVATRKPELLRRLRFVVIECADNLVRLSAQRKEGRSCHGTTSKGVGRRLHTFFGGTMATADFGAIETCGPLSFSPLIDLLRACSKRKTLATASFGAIESRVRLELGRGMTGQGGVGQEQAIGHGRVSRESVGAGESGRIMTGSDRRGREGNRGLGLMAHLHRDTTLSTVVCGTSWWTATGAWRSVVRCVRRDSRVAVRPWVGRGVDRASHVGAQLMGGNRECRASGPSVRQQVSVGATACMMPQMGENEWLRATGRKVGGAV
jgi:hypothetical protein